MGDCMYHIQGDGKWRHCFGWEAMQRHYLKEICIKQLTLLNCNLVELYSRMWAGFTLLRN